MAAAVEQIYIRNPRGKEVVLRITSLAVFEEMLEIAVEKLSAAAEKSDGYPKMKAAMAEKILADFRGLV